MSFEWILVIFSSLLIRHLDYFELMPWHNIQTTGRLDLQVQYYTLIVIFWFARYRVPC